MYTAPGLLLCSLFSFVFPSLAHPFKDEVCKFTQESPSWPSASDWADFNKTIDGRLIRPSAPAAACHPGLPEYNVQDCAVVKRRWNSSQWHSDNPVSNDWQNYNGYSCLPDNTTVCSTEGYPAFVVNATEAKHVQFAVNFARERNLRVNIKSSGHDFLGRSVQPKSLSIWTHHLRRIEWHAPTFSPQGCGITLNATAVTVGSGTQMRELYRSAGERNMMIVGGSSTTVSVGGYIIAGGHSPLSPLYGMGADNVVELQVVTADGQLRIANECTNTDLFWAIRGGGPAFGVVTSFTLQAIPTVATAVYIGVLVGNSSVEANWDAVTHIHRKWANQLAIYGAGGYLIGAVANVSNTSGWTLQVIMPNVTTVTSLQEKLDPILTGMTNITSGGVRARGRYTLYKTYGDWMLPRNRTGDDSTGFPGTGVSKLITSWLFDEKALASPGLKNALRGSVDNKTLLYQDFTAGPGTWRPPFIRPGGNSVNPGWRSAIVRPAAEKHWAGPSSAYLEQSKADFLRFGESLRQLAPRMGTYSNEADVNTPDPAAAFFGSNYRRLLDIKKRVDSQGIFWCRGCVGSDIYEETTDGKLCLSEAERNRRSLPIS